MQFLKKLVLAGAAIVSTTATANAATVVFSGDTTSAPRFSRPSDGNPPTSALTNLSFNYQPYTFTVDQAGSYSLTLSSRFDNFLVLYQNAFNPAAPLSNVLQANDDSAGNGNARITRSLLAGTNYIAVATAFNANTGGAFTLTAVGPGTAALTPAVAAVPEPATWAMMLVGFGAVGFSMRRRKASNGRAMQLA